MGLETITTDRKEEIAQSIGEILKELIKKGTAEMEAYFEDNTDKAIEELHKSMRSVYRQASQMQKEDKFGKLCYIRVFPRRVAILEGTYHFTIRLYDENGYTNPVEISEEWRPEFIETTFEKTVAAGAEKGQFPGVSAYNKRTAACKVNVWQCISIYSDGIFDGNECSFCACGRH